jgi:hypothetical protein
VAQPKTKPNDASVDAYLDAIEDNTRRLECRELVAMMSRITGQRPKMWGPSIVGFGTYHYRYASGHEGDSCLTGFSSRKGDISVYNVASFEGKADLLAKLGTYKTGKSCLYIRRLSDVDRSALECLLAGSVAEIRRRYP